MDGGVFTLYSLSPALLRSLSVCKFLFDALSYFRGSPFFNLLSRMLFCFKVPLTKPIIQLLCNLCYCRGVSSGPEIVIIVVSLACGVSFSTKPFSAFAMASGPWMK